MFYNLGGATVKNAISGNNGHPNIHTCIYNYKLIEEKCYERNDFVKLQINVLMLWKKQLNCNCIFLVSTKRYFGCNSSKKYT